MTKKFKLPDIILGTLFSVSYSYLVFFYLVNFFGIERKAGMIVALIFLAFYIPMTVARAINVTVILASIVLGLVLIFNSVDILPTLIVAALFGTAFLYTLQLTHGILESKVLQSPEIVLGFHIIQFVVVFTAAVFSLWLVELRYFVAVAGISGMLMWHPKLMDGCPMTWLEDHLRVTGGEKTNLKNAGFIRYYAKAWFGIEFQDKTYTTAVYVLTAFVVGWWIIDLFI